MSKSFVVVCLDGEGGIVRCSIEERRLGEIKQDFFTGDLLAGDIIVKEIDWHTVVGVKVPSHHLHMLG